MSVLQFSDTEYRIGAPLVRTHFGINVSSFHITQKGCAALISALRSNPSHLRELDLSGNKPGDSGVKLLSALLEDPHCKLEKLQ
ncbi:Ribonuclease inhibitor [Labeo rohita]|uniref:Ribonuclease inhibitor n=1 Tax=Labeo rohita TaxID=84645 RepID=A0ABQ8KZ25_LABRO|nr:Ribonuclease inhibitor [Labeo rohita]